MSLFYLKEYYPYLAVVTLCHKAGRVIVLFVPSRPDSPRSSHAPHRTNFTFVKRDFPTKFHFVIHLKLATGGRRASDRRYGFDCFPGKYPEICSKMFLTDKILFTIHISKIFWNKSKWLINLFYLTLVLKMYDVFNSFD